MHFLPKKRLWGKFWSLLMRFFAFTYNFFSLPYYFKTLDQVKCLKLHELFFLYKNHSISFEAGCFEMFSFRNVFISTLRPATLLKKRLWCRCFLLNFAKFPRTAFLTEHIRWLLLSYVDN